MERGNFLIYWTRISVLVISPEALMMSMRNMFSTHFRGILFLTCGCLMWASVVSLTHADEVPWWEGNTEYIVIDHDTTWEGTLTHVDIPKPVIVVNDATLTLKPGTHAEIVSLSVYDGRILALGSQTNRITLTKSSPDFSSIPAEALAESDPECFPSAYPSGMIHFAENVESDDTREDSVFQYVDFDHLGRKVSDEGKHCSSQVSLHSPVRDFLSIGTVHAASVSAFRDPALRMMNGRVKIEHSAFIGSTTSAIEVQFSFEEDWTSNDLLSVSDSEFEGSGERIAVETHFRFPEGHWVTKYAHHVLLTNNWYGHEDGPSFFPFFSSPAERLLGDTMFIGWSRMPFRCGETCPSNVLFLPGLESSRLYKNGALGMENQLWEPNREADVEKLLLDENGKSRDDSIYTRDILDEKNILPIGQGNIYKSFIEDMDKMKDTDHLINDWNAIPYDWRFSLDDILNGGKEVDDGISYIGSVSQSYIIRELERLASNSKSGKVTIIAHSNGGLVAKALIRKLGDAEAARLIDTIVLVAVPQSGTPQAIGAILHGYDQGLPFDWFSPILSIQGARTLANNMPGAYHLLPSLAYFSGEGSGVETPPITFDGGVLTNQFIGKYGHEIGDASELDAFLRDNDKKVSANSDDVVSPSMVNTKLLSYGREVHEQLDNMTIPESIAVYQIAGFGEETLGTIRYWTSSFCKVATEIGECDEYAHALLYTPDGMVDGDGTVVMPSALSMSGSNMKRYWVDLGDYNGPSTIDRKHADILEVPQLREFIRDGIITKLSPALPSFISATQPSTNSEKRLRYYLHSPLVLSLHDSEGRKTSLTASDIPGARYRHFGEVQYISVPASAHPTLMLDGELDGSFTLEVQEVEDNIITSTTTFAGIPSTAETKVTMDFPDGTIDHASSLAIDYDGDGSVDHELAPVLGGTVLLDVSDVIPPITGITVDGTEGMRDWYTSDTTLTLKATDDENGSGVEKTEYSLDTGTTWNVYTAPVSISSEGTTTVQYFSIDKSGNREEAKTKVIHIDKTAPEAKIFFNPNIQKIDIIGKDTLSVVTVVVLERPDLKLSSNKPRNIQSGFFQWHERHRRNLPDMLATLTDEAGHITRLSFEKSKDRNGFLFVRLQSLGYDGNESVLDTTLLEYKWRMGWKNAGQYHTLAAYLRGGASGLESHYISKRNETWIMEQFGSLVDDERDDDSERRPIRRKLSGMVAPYMESERGKMKIKY